MLQRNLNMSPTFGLVWLQSALYSANEMVCEKTSLILHLCLPLLLKFSNFHTKPSPGLPVPLHLLLFAFIHLMLHSFQTPQTLFTMLTHGFATCSCFWLQSHLISSVINWQMSIYPGSFRLSGVFHADWVFSFSAFPLHPCPSLEPLSCAEILICFLK